VVRHIISPGMLVVISVAQEYVSLLTVRLTSCEQQRGSCPDFVIEYLLEQGETEAVYLPL
jgi:hypothetical protein